jgi:chromosome segregation ATPase
MAATRESEIRMAAADTELQALGQRLEELKAQEVSKSARIQAKIQQLEDENLVVAELKKARETRDGELTKELEAIRAEKNSLSRRDYDLDDQLKKAKVERDDVEKRCKARGVEIERFLKLKESLVKREPAQMRELERVTAEVAQLQKASDERSARVVALRDSIKSMESGNDNLDKYITGGGGGGGGGGGVADIHVRATPGSQEALSSASQNRQLAAELQGKLQIAQEEEAQALKLVKTLQSKLSATSAATTALSADQGASPAR